MAKSFKIGNRLIGENFPPVVIAEVGINHNGSLDLAIHLSEVAIKSGAEIIKHQTHIADKEMSVEAKNIVPGNSKIDIFTIIKNSQLSENDEFKLARFITQKKKFLLVHLFVGRQLIDWKKLVFLPIRLVLENAIIILWLSIFVKRKNQ